MPNTNKQSAKELYEALMACSYVRTSQLLEAGVSPNTRVPGFDDAYPGRPGQKLSRTNLVPLNFAAFWRAKKSQIKILRRLLEAGADVHSADSQGYTPLHDSVYDNKPEPVQLLLEAGADANAATAQGFTPLHLAALDNAAKVAELLLTHGSRVNATANDGETPLAFAAMTGNAELVRALLRAGANANATETDGMTPLLRAAYYGDSAEVLQLLAEAGANLHATTQDSGAGALHYAATGGREANLRALLELGADVNTRDKLGTTALLRAVAICHSACVQLLLEAGATANFNGDNGKKLCRLALAGKEPSIIAAVEKACPDAFRAARRAHEKATRRRKLIRDILLYALGAAIAYFFL